MGDGTTESQSPCLGRCPGRGLDRLYRPGCPIPDDCFLGILAVDFEEATVAVPNASIDAAFAEKVAPMHELSWKLRAECSALAGLRDLLLPKLVTGQIDISSLNLDVLMEERVAS